MQRLMRDFFRAALASPLLVVILISNTTGQMHRTPSLIIQELDSPAGVESAEPNLYTGTDGTTYLTWIEKTKNQVPALRFAIRNAKGWSEPKTIIEAENLLANWADFPSLIALPDHTLVAHWLVKSSPDGHAYDVHISRSTDGGKSWSQPVVPHHDGTKTEHGFVSLLPWNAGRVAAV